MPLARVALSPPAATLRSTGVRVAARLELVPQLVRPGIAVARDQRVERIAEELEAFLPAPHRLGAIGVQREADTIAMLALTAWPIGTHSSLRMVS